MKENNFSKLWNIVKRLRSEKGCPWDREQDHNSLFAYLLEEVYEIAHSLEKGDSLSLAEELGDLLFLILSYIAISEEKGEFKLEDVLNKISDKMVKRHPHVFSNKKLETSQEVLEHWHQLKEKQRRINNRSIIDDIPKNIPALAQAKLTQERVSRVGFDWENAKEAYNKIKEEIRELEQNLKSGQKEKLKEEIGDLLFAIVNVARLLNIDAEMALKETVAKFMRRFKYIEAKLANQNKTISKTSLEEMEKLWQESKGKV